MSSQNYAVSLISKTLPLGSLQITPLLQPPLQNHLSERRYGTAFFPRGFRQRRLQSASGRFNTAPSLAIARQICSNDSASAASAATYRFESCVRELQSRFEVELQGVRDAYLQELAGLDLAE
jgi:hypothetical protein